jgi:hypothetical protein
MSGSMAIHKLQEKKAISPAKRGDIPKNCADSFRDQIAISSSKIDPNQTK